MALEPLLLRGGHFGPCCTEAPAALALNPLLLWVSREWAREPRSSGDAGRAKAGPVVARWRVGSGHTQRHTQSGHTHRSSGHTRRLRVHTERRLLMRKLGEPAIWWWLVEQRGGWAEGRAWGCCPSCCSF